MKAHHLSASKVDLAMVCQYWARGDVAHPVRPSGLKALIGKEVHHASDCWHKSLPIPELSAEAKPLWKSLQSWYSRTGTAGVSESAFLYDTEQDTSSYAKTGTDERDYIGVTDSCIPMRLDLLRFYPIARDIEIWDIKTGSKSNTTPAKDNLQLATQAVAVAKYFGAIEVTVSLVFPMKTKVDIDTHTLDADALDEHAGKLRKLLRMIPDSQPERGSHCFRCPIGPSKSAVSTCPAWATNEEEIAL